MGCRFFLTLFCVSALLQRSFGADPDLAKLPPVAAKTIDFSSDIQPIFESTCLKCHGEEKPKSGFALDNREHALKGGENGIDIIPGNSAKSSLVHFISGLVEDMQMPPPKKGEPLSREQIGLIRAWIDQGAIWPANLVLAAKETNTKAKELAQKLHWAFKAPVRPKVPKVSNESWVRNPIDAFILAKLDAEKLQPSLEADKVTLLRRLSLDLTGLPPTIEEIDAFLYDNSADAYEKQVERLLKSPHYGERWARHWLDAARYADSDGYEKDKSRYVWFYRDYVINAFNRDLPYNQFIIEQIAGDQLPNANQDQIVATGFLRNSMVNEEGGVDPEQFRMDAMFDRMDCIGKSILGLTIQCAQCHNHKFDPLKQEEYYKMFAFINNDHEPFRLVYTPAEMIKRERVAREIQEAEAALRHTTSDWEERMQKWEDQVKDNQPTWTVIKPTVEEISTGGERYLPQEDGSFLALGYAPTKHTVKLWITNDLPSLTAFRLELLNDPNLPCNGPGRADDGTCALTEFKVEVREANNPTNKHMVKFASATADFSQKEAELGPMFYDKSDNRRVVGPVSYAIDGDDKTAWGIDAGPGRRNQPRKAVFQCETNIVFPGGTILVVQLMQNHGGWNSDDHMNNNLGRFRLSIATNAEPVSADPLPKKVREILAIEKEKRTPAQINAVFSYWRTTVPEFKETNDKIEALYNEYPAGETALTLMARKTPRETHILKRGDWLKPEAAVTAGVPSFLHQLPKDAPATRLTFAEWLVDNKSPTTARVFVNRIWQSYFGIGLVATPEDFGMQSEAPSHPELLDWLACEFMENGWSVKHIHRLIVSSAAYRQTSKINPEISARDPYNRLLARCPRLRVDGEIVRDITLAASGLLNEKVGGPSVYSPAPEFLFLPPASYAPFPWKEEKGENRYRRALYTFRRRSTPYPFIQTFDVPNADSSCVRRMRSNTPLQALMTLNETVSMECAQSLAKKALEQKAKSDEERLQYMFRRTLARRPTTDENEEMLNLLEKEKKRIGEGWVNASMVATGKESPENLPEGATPTQLAAYTVISRVLLNLDETITKE